ncbi:NB-ARC domains-containing protein [Tanacetum coccineum]
MDALFTVLIIDEQVPESIGGLSCLKELNLKGNNLLEVPESIGGLSCLEILYLGGNNFTSLPGSLSQFPHLEELSVDGCKKLEVLPELPPEAWYVDASDCTSLREVLGSSGYPTRSYFTNCPKLFKNVTIDSDMIRGLYIEDHPVMGLIYKLP